MVYYEVGVSSFWLFTPLSPWRGAGGEAAGGEAVGGESVR